VNIAAVLATPPPIVVGLRRRIVALIYCCNFLQKHDFSVNLISTSISTIFVVEGVAYPSYAIEFVTLARLFYLRPKYDNRVIIAYVLPLLLLRFFISQLCICYLMGRILQLPFAGHLLYITGCLLDRVTNNKFTNLGFWRKINEIEYALNALF